MFLSSQDPIFVLEHNIPIDTSYYLENQLSKPLMRIFEPILGDIRVKSELLSEFVFPSLSSQSIVDTNTHTHTHTEGSHTLSKTVVTSSGGFGMLSKFTKKKSSCIGCRAVLDNDSKLINSKVQQIENVTMVETPTISTLM